MNKVWAVLMAGAAMIGAAGAETEVDAYGLGHHKPAPESWLKLDDDLSIRVRILRANGDLAEAVPAPEVLQAEVSLYGEVGAADREVRLLCSAWFKDAEAVTSEPVIFEQPCYAGKLSDAEGRFVPLKMDLFFRPVVTDPAGTSAVLIEVTDRVVEDGVTLTPTYGWLGGRK